MRTRRWRWWAASPVLALLLLFLAAVFLASDREPRTLNEHERSRLPGSFVALSHGYTNYEVMGPASGPVVLLVPGISIPRGVFARTVAPLAQAGYRVITFDLYGRGFSDRPRVRYDAALFNRQIDDLLAALRAEGPVHLVGLASGGLQSLLYAEAHPGRVESLVLICPDGVDAPVSGFARMIRTPLVGELAGRLVMNAVGQRRWEERLQGYSADPRLVEDVVRQFRGQLVYEGFWRALVSSIASLPISESSDLFRRIDRQGTRTLVLWGASDVIIPVHLGREVRRLMPSATYVEIAAGHLPQYERPDLTNEAILRFLRRDPAGPRASRLPAGHQREAGRYRNTRGEQSRPSRTPSQFTSLR
jgi:pimeloyl-ACP methyl ester carboxylesterase